MSKILTRECKFALHLPKTTFRNDDVHLVKLLNTHEDGTTTRELKLIKNYERPIYIAKPNHRNYKDRREYESLENVNILKSTQSDLLYNASKALGVRGRKYWSIRELNHDYPYIYGAEISSEAVLKHHINSKLNNTTKNSVATFDVETNVLNDNKEIIIASSGYMRDGIYEIVLAYDLSWLMMSEKKSVDEINEKINKYISEYVAKYNIKFIVIPCKSESEIVINIFNQLHKWKPDFLAIWNINFDIPVVLSCLERAGINPIDVLCDPDLPYDPDSPHEYRVCEYVPGPSYQVTSSLKHKPISPANQWHTLILSASFYVIDAMCVYRQLRISKPEEPSYKLDKILKKVLGIRKLNFKEAEHLVDFAWHSFMQTRYKVEYIIYNLFDNISLNELELKTKDLSLSISVFAGCTPYSKFKSQPSKLVDDYHYFLLNEGKVLGTMIKKPYSSNDNDEDVDIAEEDVDTEGFTESEKAKYDILSLRQWIVTLRADFSSPGMNVVKEIPTLKSYFRILNNDSDLEAAYPTLTYIFNVSINTTRKELCSVEGYDELIYRSQNINFLFGSVNVLQYANVMLKFPKPRDVLEVFKKEMGISKAA